MARSVEAALKDLGRRSQKAVDAGKMIASAREFALYVDIYRIGSAAAQTFAPATAFPPGVVAPLGAAREVAEELRPGIEALAPDPAIYLRRP